MEQRVYARVDGSSVVGVAMIGLTPFEAHCHEGLIAGPDGDLGDVGRYAAYIQMARDRRWYSYADECREWVMSMGFNVGSSRDRTVVRDDEFFRRSSPPAPTGPDPSPHPSRAFGCPEGEMCPVWQPESPEE